MNYMQCIVILAIVSHIFILCIKNNHKEGIYLFNTVVLFFIWSNNTSLSIPSAFAILSSLYCIFNPKYKYCWNLVSYLSLGIFIYYLLQNPRVLEGHIFGIQPKEWKNICSLPKQDSNCSSIVHQNQCDQCESNDCYWLSKKSKCIYLPSKANNKNDVGVSSTTISGAGTNTISPSDIPSSSGGGSSGSSSSGGGGSSSGGGGSSGGSSGGSTSGGGSSSGDNNYNETNICRMSGYCNTYSSTKEPPIEYCVKQTGSCVWDTTGNTCIDRDDAGDDGTYYDSTNYSDNVDDYTYKQYKQDGKCNDDSSDDDSN